MIIRVGYIPYLNMAPFHNGFGPGPLEIQGRSLEFHTLSPRLLGLEADRGTIDAGAFSMVDWLRCFSQYEPIGSLGIGVKRAAQSVLLFSNRPLPELRGVCAVTDETATSVRLLQLLVDVRYGLTGLRYGRVASSLMFDGDADALLLIGDEALRAKKEGIRGLPHVADLGEEWFRWHGVPFVFARWAVRHALRQDVKDILEVTLQNSLKTNTLNKLILADEAASARRMSPASVVNYWDGFAYELTPDHDRSIAIFSQLLEKECLTA